MVTCDTNHLRKRRNAKKRGFFVSKNKNFFTYGFSKKSNFRIFNTVYKKNYSIFDIKISIPGIRKTVLKKIKLNLIGAYNILNSASAIAICLHIGIDIKVIRNALKK